MDVLGALGLPGGARGVVEDRGCFGAGGVDVEALDARGGLHVEENLAGLELALLAVHDDNRLQGREGIQDFADLAHVLLGGEDGAGSGAFQADLEGVV
ncbi:MAG: hypothetical protein NTW26_11200, partial [bacterium]|nr:hypothetical protein [bacterium]